MSEIVRKNLAAIHIRTFAEFFHIVINVTSVKRSAIFGNKNTAAFYFFLFYIPKQHFAKHIRQENRPRFSLEVYNCLLCFDRLNGYKLKFGNTLSRVFVRFLQKLFNTAVNRAFEAVLYALFRFPLYKDG